MRFVQTAADRSPGSDLLAAMLDELEPRYGRVDVPGAPSATPTETSPPTGAFLVGFDDRRAVCCGGLKRLSDGAAEIKRMYVVPNARGRGVAGHRSIGDFNGNPFASFWREKVLIPRGLATE